MRSVLLIVKKILFLFLFIERLESTIVDRRTAPVKSLGLKEVEIYPFKGLSVI